MSELGRNFSDAELVNRITQASEDLGTEIQPPSIFPEDIVRMPEAELRQRFPKRYEAYVALLRSQARNGDMAEAEHINMVKWISALNSLDNYIEQHNSDPENQLLRERQATVFEDIRDALERGENSGYVVLPTGVGKTVIFTKLVEAMNLKTIITVPQVVLAGQTGERIKQFAPNLEFGEVSGIQKTRGKQVTVMVHNSFVNEVKNGALKPEEYDLIIIDEAHTFNTTKRIEALSKFTNAIKIGFTATPDYAENKKLSSILETEIHVMELKEAIEEGLLSGAVALFVGTQVDLSRVRITGGDYNEQELNAAINTAGRNRAMVEAYQSLFPGKKAIVYCANKAHSEAVSEAFQAAGTNAAFVHSGLDITEIEERKAAFARGEIMVLSNPKMLIAGYDEPTIEVVINAVPTLSVVNATQRAGRGLRLDPQNPDKVCFEVDVLDKNMQPSQAPITVPEVLGATWILPAHASESMKQSHKVVMDKNRITIEGIEVITDPIEIGAEVKKNVEAKYKPVPPDWHNVSEIMKLLGVKSSYTIDTFGRKFLTDHPEWKGTYIGKNGRPGIFYHPGYMEAVKSSLAGREYAPEGSVTVPAFAEQTGFKEKDIRATVQALSAQYPEEFKPFPNSRGKLVPHLTTRGQELIARELGAEAEVPEHWPSQDEAVAAIVSAVSIDEDQALSLLQAEARFYTQKRGRTLDGVVKKGSRLVRHFGPLLIGKIIEQLQEHPPAPSTVLSFNQLAIKLRMKPSELHQAFSSLGLDEETLGTLYTNTDTGSIELFYPTSLVNQIKTDYKK